MPARMRLRDYLDTFSWSQAELCRRSGISAQCAKRALAGETIKRRSAEAILFALQSKYRELGLRGAITLASVKDLRISELTHRKPVVKPSEEDNVT